MDFTKEIETPIGKHKVVFKTILSVAERERVETSAMQFIETDNGTDFKLTNTAQVTLAEKHELLRVSVVSIDGDTVNCFDRIQKMYDKDGAAILEAILAEQKKMKD
ncbi:MAG: hypothetical protein C0429_09715 [Sphingopyxis sp.]|nr:hypothetical protein [Sphingopyxis sp.]